MKTMKLEHFALNVSEPDRTAQWYVDHFHMEIVMAGRSAPFIHFLTDKDRMSMIEFYRNDDASVPDYGSMDPLTFHIAFSVENIKTVITDLTAAGASPAGDIAVTPAGDQLAFIRDPWGVPIQLVCRKKPII